MDPDRFKNLANFNLFERVFIGIFLAFLPANTNAQGLESLLMPGPVIKGHAEFQAECSKCHSLFEKQSQSGLCKDCHKKVAKDIELKKGLHGLTLEIPNSKCNFCHTDHEGREADIIKLDKEAFDHKLTDFSLKGSHQIVKCEKCHVPEKLFREAPVECFACHKFDDPHKERLGRKCGNCHEESTWDKATFDHDKKTKYPLKGAHRKLQCNSCHPGEQYKKIPVKCIGCHVLNDVHRGELGRKCEKCHIPEKWKKVEFDHNRNTKFPLKDSHSKLKCRDCHHGNPEKEKLKKECIACHKNDDEHKGGFGKKCHNCHTSKSWKDKKFNHDRDTKFKLVGSHVRRQCHDCHKGIPEKEKLKSACIDCHKFDDVHKGQEGEKCDKCHNQNAWRKNVKFDHDKTKFPLVGIHKHTTCESCHLTTEFKNASTQCIDCHLKADYHRGRMPNKCDKCHSPKSWKSIEFEHGKQTKFKLKGRHQKIDCHLCHSQPASEKIKLPKTCIGCHKDDDVHNEGQGKDCEKCHNQESWEKDVHFDHSLTRFPLVGRHSIATCENCHLTSQFKKVESGCVDCHLQSDQHKKRLGANCGLCHTSEGWGLWKFDHELQTEFALQGAHEKLNCLLCHKAPLNKEFSMKKSCFGCHESDDIHKGQEGRNCDKCHNQSDWKRETRFDHDITSFPLIGIHAITACENCHLSSEFKTVESSCISCHRKDDSHKMRLGPACETCHTPNHWNLWQFDHNLQTEFRLDGAHEGLECEGCHRQEIESKIELSRSCFSCHQSDDKHRGKFGRQCVRCHSTSSFQDVRIKRWRIN